MHNEYTLWPVNAMIYYMCENCKKMYSETFRLCVENIDELLNTLEKTCLNCNPYEPIPIMYIVVHPALEVLGMQSGVEE